MTFTNSITGGQGTLVRPQIKSPDYVPGVSGWIIRRDGSAEFNDITARGDIIAGTPGGARIEILNAGPTITIYNSLNQLVADITPTTGFTTYDPDEEARARLITDIGQSVVSLHPGTEAGHTIQIARVASFLNNSGSPDVRAFTELRAADIDALGAALLTLASNAADLSVTSSASIAADRINLFSQSETNFGNSINTVHQFFGNRIEMNTPVQLNLITPAIPTENHGGGNPTWTGATTYTETPGGSAAFGRSFIAPPSGNVDVTVEGWIGTNSTTVNRRSYLSFNVRQGSVVGAGALVSAANDQRAGMKDNDRTTAGFKYSSVTVCRLITGLTPETAYNITTAVRIDNAADTGATNERHVKVIPLLP